MSYHPDIDETLFSEIPVGFDLFLCDEKYLNDYVDWLVKSFETGDCSNRPMASYASWAENVTEESIHLKVVIEFIHCHHRYSTFLPKEHFRACLDSHRYDEKPHVFVDSSWYASLQEREFSCFGLFDAIGVREEIQACRLSESSLSRLEEEVQQVASKYTDVLFVGFADSILLKQQWSLGNYSTNYKPELLLKIYHDLRDVYKDVLGLNSYIVLTQGENISSTGRLFQNRGSDNFFSLNSLGVPFAEIMAIEKKAKENIRKNGICNSEGHPKADIYMDEDFYFSLQLSFKLSNLIEQRSRRVNYQPIFPIHPELESPRYYWFNVEDLLPPILG